VTLSWILQLGAAVIPRPTSPAHFEELRVFLENQQSKGKLKVFLDVDDMKKIAALDGTLP
jgi:diketogulonate reductase-like aldo/keto reductase